MSAERARLTHEQRVVVGLVEDVLRATPGLRCRLDLIEAQHDGGHAAHAIVVIETAPERDLRRSRS